MTAQITYMGLTAPCSCNPADPKPMEIEKVEGCERCERMCKHGPQHNRCNHGAHCTRDYCW